MAPLKAIILLVLVTVCTCNPGYRRKTNPDGTEKSVDSHHKQEEGVLEPKGLPVDAVEETVSPVVVINNDSQQEQEYDVRALLRNKILEQSSYQPDIVDSNEEELKNPVQASKPAKLISFDKTIFKSESMRPILIKGSIDPYEKILESVIRGIMSRVLQAEIKQVRIEDMGQDRRKNY